MDDAFETFKSLFKTFQSLCVPHIDSSKAVMIMSFLRSAHIDPPMGNMTPSVDDSSCNGTMSRRTWLLQLKALRGATNIHLKLSDKATRQPVDGHLHQELEAIVLGIMPASEITYVPPGNPLEDVAEAHSCFDPAPPTMLVIPQKFYVTIIPSKEWRKPARTCTFILQPSLSGTGAAQWQGIHAFLLKCRHLHTCRKGACAF